MNKFFSGLLVCCFLLCAPQMFAQEDLPQEFEESPDHPLSVHWKPKFTVTFVGLDLGGGITQEPKGAFNAGIHGGVTFFYKDVQSSLFNAVMGFFLNTSVYGGFDFNVSKGRFAWAPKVGLAQLLGPVLVGVEALFYTPTTFKEYDIRIYPYFGVSLLNIFSLTVGPSLHVGGQALKQVSSWRAYFTLRIPIEFMMYILTS